MNAFGNIILVLGLILIVFGMHKNAQKHDTKELERVLDKCEAIVDELKTYKGYSVSRKPGKGVTLTFWKPDNGQDFQRNDLFEFVLDEGE